MERPCRKKERQDVRLDIWLMGQWLMFVIDYESYRLKEAKGSETTREQERRRYKERLTWHETGLLINGSREV